ncbi:3-deoxy-D-manno-octulosonic-acid transferase [Syntrophus gentianae]|uniref:3-deoxy-D-manno-octulosonic acid transferase n=2 Tax=Syntrophus gentianae TaxID=43775 RepID=A0A1H7UET4_9BACT|nr:3-deoxy-D-manno-octulosonic-acid transferase [Syntrophus gentianae]
MMYLYNLLLPLAALIGLPYYAVRMFVTGKYRKSLGPKLGYYADENVFSCLQGSPRIWVHAVSVGEVTAAAPVVAELRSRYPGACIVLSTSTETGQEMAGRLISQATELIYYPLDLPFVVAGMLKRVQPDIFVPTETELWPNFLSQCRKRGIRVVLVNGRISPRSFRRYGRTRFFWKGLLAGLDGLGMISETDARRVLALGALPEKVQVLGNTKYDSLASRTSAPLQEEIARKLDIRPGSPVFVAGSTHEGEEAVCLSVYRRLLEFDPEFKLILVPRHIERGSAVAELVRQAGFQDVIRVSEIDGGRKRVGERIVLVDVIGELFKVYSLATIVYCGGSLVPRGGQNILEAAAWGKVVFYGPSMEDFEGEKALLEEAGAGISVADEEELRERMLSLLADPEMLRRRGEQGRLAIAANAGAARRHADLIGDSLEGR